MSFSGHWNLYFFTFVHNSTVPTSLHCCKFFISVISVIIFNIFSLFFTVLCKKFSFFSVKISTGVRTYPNPDPYSDRQACMLIRIQQKCRSDRIRIHNCELYLLVQVETCGDYAKCPICQKNIKSTFIIRHIKSHDFPTIILKVGGHQATSSYL